MKRKLPDQNSPYQILVEGPDDKGVLVAFLEHCQLVIQPFVSDAGSYEKLRNKLEALITPGSALEKIGLVVDADTDAQSRWESLRARLIDSGYVNVPHKPDLNGTIITDPILPKVGIWIMPDNYSSGMIEDYMAFLVPDADLLLDRARKVLDDIPQEQRKFGAIHHPKALVHTWLAWQQEPGRPMGQAITKKFFASNSPHFETFKLWITLLFD